MASNFDFMAKYWPDRVRALKYADLLPKRIDDMFYTLRKARNDAVHTGLDSTERAAALLHLGFNLCCWLMEVYGDWSFNAPEYKMPENPTQQADFMGILMKNTRPRRSKLRRCGQNWISTPSSCIKRRSAAAIFTH